jgi:hypothetical protein
MMNKLSSPFELAVKELSYLTRRLDIFGRAVTMVTLIHFSITFFAVVFALSRDGIGLRAFNVEEVRIALLGLDLAVLTISLLYLSRFERFSRRGELYFLEIANEKNWAGEDEERLRLEYRIALREFSLSSELPFTRGMSGVSLYFIVNALITLLVWVMVLFVIQAPTSF